VEALLAAFAGKARSAAVASLEMGTLGLAYLRARLARSAQVTREEGTKALHSRWQEHSETTVTLARVNALLHTAATWEVLSGGQPYEGKGLPSLRVVRAFNRLTERVPGRSEGWRLAGAHQQAARALWAEALAKGLSGKECAAAVQALRRPSGPGSRATADSRGPGRGRSAGHPARRDDADGGDCPQGHNLLLDSRNFTVKDAAELVRDVIANHPCPDDVFAEVCSRLLAHGAASRHLQQACQAAKVQLAKAGDQGARPLQEPASDVLSIAAVA
jgi:hypothetical protein